MFQAGPCGTCQSPWQPHSQSVSLMISFCAATKVSTGHIPSCWSGQPLIPVNGTTPSFMMTLICGSGMDEHDSTENHAIGCDQPRMLRTRACHAYAGIEYSWRTVPSEMP